MRDIAQVRRAGPHLPHTRMHKQLQVQHSLSAGQSVYTVSPQGQTSLSGGSVLYLHGGAYVRPITRFHWHLIEELVHLTGCTITVPLYPLAPEHTCQQTVGFVRTIYDGLLAQAPDGAPATTLMGDSAGGGLALALTTILCDQGVPLPSQLILITPWVDVDSAHPMLAQTARRDPMLAIDGAREAGRLYAGALPTNHPWVSPIHADLHGLPPTTILAGTRDLSHHDAVDLAHKARSQGSSVDLRLGQDMIHVWPLLPIPEGRQARVEIAELIRRKSATSTTTPLARL